jgi:hypothetical protein
MNKLPGRFRLEFARENDRRGSKRGNRNRSRNRNRGRYQTPTPMGMGSRRVSQSSDGAELAETMPIRTAHPHLSLDQTLVEHRVGYFDEAGDIGASHVVARQTVFGGSLDCSAMDCSHDGLEAAIYFLPGPGEAH